MIEWTRQVKENRPLLQLSGDLGIGHADELRSILQSILTETGAVEIDVSSVAETDVACLQLFCASHKMAMRLSKHIRFSGKWSETFTEAVRGSGFLRHAGCCLDNGNECLWMKGQADG
jgi:ABC-type transporter Mla MlaB component